MGKSEKREAFAFPLNFKTIKLLQLNYFYDENLNVSLSNSLLARYS